MYVHKITVLNLFIHRVFKSVNVFVCTVYGRPIGHLSVSPQ